MKRHIVPMQAGEMNSTVMISSKRQRMRQCLPHRAVSWSMSMVITGIVCTNISHMSIQHHPGHDQKGGDTGLDVGNVCQLRISCHLKRSEKKRYNKLGLNTTQMSND